MAGIWRTELKGFFTTVLTALKSGPESMAMDSAHALFGLRLHTDVNSICPRKLQMSPHVYQTSHSPSMLGIASSQFTCSKE